LCVPVCAFLSPLAASFTVLVLGAGVRYARIWVTSQAKAKGHIAGQLVPEGWLVGTDYHFGVPATVFEAGEVIVLKRSDGSTKFGLVQKLDEPSAGIHVVLVDVGQESNAVKTLHVHEIGKVWKPSACALAVCSALCSIAPFAFLLQTELPFASCIQLTLDKADVETGTQM